MREMVRRSGRHPRVGIWDISDAAMHAASVVRPSVALSETPRLQHRPSTTWHLGLRLLNAYCSASIHQRTFYNTVERFLFSHIDSQQATIAVVDTIQ